MPQLRWLVTGCSSGIGEAFVRSILARGDKVVASTRGDVSRLWSLKEAGADTVSLDVTASLSDLRSVIEKTLEEGPLDVLVNNARYIEAGIAEETRYAFPISISVRFSSYYAKATRTTSPNSKPIFSELLR
jgi:NAD(P)-dependent dehydrogenase (short-subunit alcohol dehydrogenase family)